MGFGFTSSEDTERGGEWLDENGTYHFVIQSVNEEPTNKNDQLIGNAFEVELVAMEGTPRKADKSFKHLGKKCTEMIFNVDPSGTQAQQDFTRKKLTRFFIATNQMAPNETNKDVDIDLKKLVGQHFIATMGRNKKEFYGFKGTDIWHLDDPEAKDFPRDESAYKATKGSADRLSADAFGQGATAPEKPKQPAMSEDDVLSI